MGWTIRLQRLRLLLPGLLLLLLQLQLLVRSTLADLCQPPGSETQFAPCIKSKIIITLVAFW
jgi:hypothetical protein